MLRTTARRFLTSSARRQHLERTFPIALCDHILRRHVKVFGQRQRHGFGPAVRQGEVVGRAAHRVRVPFYKDHRARIAATNLA